jgi:hypothetical protein
MRNFNHIAIQDLGLTHLWVVYPGDQTYDLDTQITVFPLEEKIQGKLGMY